MGTYMYEILSVFVGLSVLVLSVFFLTEVHDFKCNKSDPDNPKKINKESPALTFWNQMFAYWKF